MAQRRTYRRWAILCAVAVVVALVAVGAATSRIVSTQGKTALDITHRIYVPILLYHHISTDETMLGKFCIAPSELENDLIYIKENGYTPIHIRQLVDYCYSGTPLPERPVVITFDGCFSSGYAYAFKLLQKYDAKAVFAIVGADVDRASAQSRSTDAAYLRWSELREMTESGLVEIANQSYDMNHYTDTARRGTARLKSEDMDTYSLALYDDVMKLQQEASDVLGVIPSVFSYPYGIIDKDAVNLISEMGFAVTLSWKHGANYLSQDTRDLFSLRRTVRMHGEYLDDVFDRIYRARIV
ncbi:MAG: polysaccharide deacetylase family protein [Acetanaerobacterium sp.]